MRNFVIILWLLRVRGRVSGGRAEDTCVILPTATVALKLLRITTQRIGFAQITENTAIIGIVDDRKRLLRGLAEPVKGAAEIVAGQKEGGRLADKLSYAVSGFAAVRKGRLAWINNAAQAATIVDDKHLPGAARRETAVKLANGQFGGDDCRVAPHHRSDEQLVDPADILRAADRQPAEVKAPSRERIAKPVPHRDRRRNHADHDPDCRRKVARRL